MAPQKARGPGAITATRSGSGRSLLADPSRVDRGRSGSGPGRHQKRAGLACFRLSHRQPPDCSCCPALALPAFDCSVSRIGRTGWRLPA